MLLEVKNISKSFGEKQVLRNISFSAQSGSALGLLGRNGAGKTTTIRIIMQLFTPNGGEVLVDGKPIDIKTVNIGYMPEERGLYPKKKVIEQLIYFGELRGLPSGASKESAKRLLKRLEMEEYANAKLSTLSKGNQQKIQLIATLISNPDIVILDEPFSGLDPVNAMLLKDVVRELIANGKIVIFSSHQMNYIEEFCDNIVILNDGVISVSGNIKEIKQSYTNNKVSIETEDKEAALKLFMGENCVKRTEFSDKGVVVELVEWAEIKDIMSVLADSKIKLSGVSLYEPSLNEIFVDYTDTSEEEVQS